jgi:hypothetical protein
MQVEDRSGQPCPSGASGCVWPPQAYLLAMTAPYLRPMNEFDPLQPAILHDRRSDRIVTWTGEEAADYLAESNLLPDGSVEWRDFHFDGWGNVLGG